MLKIQQWLFDNNGNLELLKSDYGIKYRIYPDLDLVILNYDSLNSNKCEELVQECRGLILQLNTWNIVAYPFYRFFNYYEQHCNNIANFNFVGAIALEKLDGSMITLFYWKDKWFIATRNDIGGQNKNNQGQQYDQLFEKSIPPNFYNHLNTNWTYIFELTAPDNRVIKCYNDRSVNLLAIRDEKYHELPLSVVQQYGQELNVKTPTVYQFNDLNDLRNLVSTFDATDEGIVCVDYSSYCSDGMSFKRIKVKNPSYLAIANIKGGASIKNFITLVLRGESDEFLTYYPQYKNIINQIEQKYKHWINKFNEELNYAKTCFDLDNKDFANHIQYCKFKSILFDIKMGKLETIHQYIEFMLKNKCKSFCKQLTDDWDLNNVDYLEPNNSDED